MSDMLFLPVFFLALPAAKMVGLFLYLFVINIAAFAAFGLDKYRARSAGRRIPEAAFFIMALAGAVPGLWFGLGAFRHKTRKASFRFGLPLIALMQVIIVVWLLRK